MPANQWVHVALNVNRSTNQVTIYFGGVSQGSYDISSLSGNIHCTQDLQLGVINGGEVDSQAQKSGLDDVAFYPRTLTPGEITSLAAATLTPVRILDSNTPHITAYSHDTSSGESTITFFTDSGFDYSLWGSTDLVNWNELIPSITGTGNDVTETNTPEGSPTTYFYQTRKN